jgi:hypothetical protein
MVRLERDVCRTGAGGRGRVYREVFLEEIVMGAGVGGPEPRVDDVVDEVSRQRRKHWDESLNRPVAGFPDVTLRDVVDEVQGATASDSGVFRPPDQLVVPGEARPVDAVGRFLAGRGHTPETIRTVQGYLDLQRALESRRRSRPTGPGAHEAQARRSWVLEELQSRLLED